MPKDFEVISFNKEGIDGGHLRMKINTPKPEIKGFLSALEVELVKANPDFRVMTEICFDLVCRLHLPIWKFMPGSFILRARQNVQGAVFKHASEISYNPFPQKIPLGRFNLAGEAVFYGSTPSSGFSGPGYVGALCEATKELFNPKSRQNRFEFTVGKWFPTDVIHVVLLTFCDGARKNNKDAMSISQRFFGEMQDAMSPEDFEIWREFQEFFSKRAARRYDNDGSYLVTTAFFHAVQRYYGDMFGILYSSSMTENQGLNVVFPKKVIELGLLDLDGALMVRCQRDPGEFKKYNIFPCSDYAQADRSGRFVFSNIF